MSLFYQTIFNFLHTVGQQVSLRASTIDLYVPLELLLWISCVLLYIVSSIFQFYNCPQKYFLTVPSHSW